MASYAEQNLLPRRDRRLVAFSIAWAIFCLAADYATGPGVQFGSLYAIPVVVAAWESQRVLSIVIALGLPAVEFFLDRMWGSFSDTGDELFTTFVRVVALVVLALLVDRFSRTRLRVEHRIALPPDHIVRCDACGRVQDAEGAWWSLDERLGAHLAGAVTPVRCPECAARAVDAV
jgi:hypothetical protein